MRKQRSRIVENRIASFDIEMAPVARKLGGARNPQPITEVRIDQLILVVGQTRGGSSACPVEWNRNGIALRRINIEIDAIWTQELRRIATQAYDNVAGTQPLVAERGSDL